MKKTKIFGLILLIAAISLSSCSNLDESSYIIKPTGDSILYSETFASSFGLFTSKSVLGDQVWTLSSNSYIGMSGYVSATKLSYANEDWLISPEINLTNIPAANVSFEYVAHLMGDVSKEITVWVSDNYVTDSLPSKATWVQLTTSLIADPGNYVFTSSGQISLTAFSGKKIKVALKYISTAAKAGTFEARNFVIMKTEARNPAKGKGTRTSPYSISEAVFSSGLAWVEGYVVGYVNTANANSPVYSADGCTIKTNVLLADTTGSVYFAKCLAVDLSNVTIQNGVNISTTPANFGKHIKIYGQIGALLGISGLNSASYFEFDNGTSGGIVPPDPIYAETFVSGLGLFTAVSASGQENWAWNSYKYAMMTGYVGSVNKADEAWLISPEIDLTGVAAPKLTFDHVTRYFNNPITDATIWISSNYLTGLPSTATWTQLIPPIPFANATSWPTPLPNAGIFDLSAYTNMKVKIAFKYVSTTTKAGTWEMKNFMVYK
jgi:Domain of unknown function (DUF6359)